MKYPLSKLSSHKWSATSWKSHRGFFHSNVDFPIDEMYCLFVHLMCPFYSMQSMGVAPYVRKIPFEELKFRLRAVMAEWLRRWTWNPMGSSRAGSNPARSEFFLLGNNNPSWNGSAIMFHLHVLYNPSISQIRPEWHMWQVGLLHQLHRPTCPFKTGCHCFRPGSNRGPFAC